MRSTYMMKPFASLMALSLLASCASTPAPEPAPKPMAEAEMAFDRSIMPTSDAEVEFAPPAVQRGTLSNGMEVLVAESHELPIVGYYLVVMAGTAQDPVGKAGVANLAAELLPRGTETMDAAALSDAMGFLGVNYGANASLDFSSASLVTLKKHNDKALTLWSEMILDPAYDAEELERLRTQITTGLIQRKDRPQAIAGDIFRRRLYGDVYHGRNGQGTPESVKGLSRDDVVAFYKTWYRPNNAAIIVSGDLTLKEALPKLEAAFGGWEKGTLPAKAIQLPDAPKEQVVYLHHKAGAPQSQIAIGTLGMARSDDRYVPATLMNRVLGGSFQSRINLNLREDKGYTYGAYSGFSTSLLPGPFYTGGGFRTDVTLESVQELLGELKAIGADRPVSEADLEYHRGSMARSFPSGFESAMDLMGNLATVAVYDLPDDYFTNYIGNLQAQSLEQVNEMSKMVDPSQMIIVIVGDQDQVMAPLTEAGFKVILVDDMGDPVAM